VRILARKIGPTKASRLHVVLDRPVFLCRLSFSVSSCVKHPHCLICRLIDMREPILPLNDLSREIPRSALIVIALKEEVVGSVSCL
jgi:hypothetical protein